MKRNLIVFIKSLNYINFLPIVFFLFLPLIYTFPLIFEIRSFVAGFGDVWQHIWNLWWFHYITQVHSGNPFFTDFMYYPTGASLVFHSYSPYNMVLGLFLQHWLSLSVVYNLLIWKSFFLSGLFAYLLGKHLTGSNSSGLLAGIIWSYSSYHISRIMFFHLFTTEMVPLYCYFLVRSFETKKPVYSIAAGVTLALTALSTWYYLIFMLIFTIIEFFFFQGYKRIKGYLITLSLTFLILLPFFYYPILFFFQGKQYMNVSSGMAKIFSADLLSFLIFPENHPLFSWLVSPFYARVHTHITERTNYLGIIAIILFIVWLFSKYNNANRQNESSLTSNTYDENSLYLKFSMRFKAFWLTIFFVGIIMSLGPFLQFNGVVYRNIPLPFHYLRSLPIFRTMRAPERFLILTNLSLSVGASFGWKILLHYRTKSKFKPTTILVRTSLIIVILLIDYLCFFPFPSSSTKVSSYYQEIRKDKDKGAIIDYPLPQQDYSKPLFYQTIHQKRMFGGYVSRTPENAEKFINAHPFLQFAYSARLSIERVETKDLERLTNKFNIKYLIIHKRQLPQLTNRWIFLWANSLLGSTIFQDNKIVVYNLKNILNEEADKGYNRLEPPFTIPCTMFRHKDNGKAIQTFHKDIATKEWVLWENGSISQEFNINFKQTYLLYLIARGTSVKKIYPEIEVLVDNKKLNLINLDKKLTKYGPFEVDLTKGLHKIELQFKNDEQTTTEDRNAYFLAFKINSRN